MLDTKRTPAFLIAAVACTLTLHWTAVTAADVPAKVSDTIGVQTKTEAAGKGSQKRIDALDDEASSLVGQYRQALAETTSLKAYNDQLAVQTKSQGEELDGLNQQLAQIDATSHDVLPLLTDMLSTLEQFVKLDTPFLQEERTKRIDGLKDMMSRADVSISEKYRRIVEAYQIEMEYGRTLEAYQGKVGDKTVDFMRAGRVALLYQTLDGKETGYWDTDTKSWKVDNSYGQDIKADLKIAKKQAAPDFLTVPLHAPTEAK